jgi:hypothetical protein
VYSFDEAEVDEELKAFREEVRLSNRCSIKVDLPCPGSPVYLNESLNMVWMNQT